MTDNAPLFDGFEFDEALWEGISEGSRRAFLRYHREHPEVYVLFKRFAGELRAASRERYSARTIVERIRWHYAVNPDCTPDGFKITNYVSPHYARLLIQEEPEWAPFFVLRKGNGGGGGPQGELLEIA